MERLPSPLRAAQRLMSAASPTRAWPLCHPRRSAVAHLLERHGNRRRETEATRGWSHCAAAGRQGASGARLTNVGDPTTTGSPDPPGRWSALHWLGLAALLAMTTWFPATAVVPQVRESWSLPATSSASLTLAVQLGFVVGALASAAANLADLLPPTRLMLIGSIGTATANALLLPASSAALAVPLRFLTGAFLAGVYPPALKHLATWFRTGRGTALGLMVGALTVGSALPHHVNGTGGATGARSSPSPASSP